MPTINLDKLPCFRDSKALQILNRIVATNSTLTTDQVAQSTGCPPELALELLAYLYRKELVHGYLQVFHDKHPDGPPASVVPIGDGPPVPPFICSVCEDFVESSTELFFELLFRPVTDIEFVVNHDAADT